MFTWIQTGLLGANLVWTTACLGGARTETAVLTVALTGALLCVHALRLAFLPEPPCTSPPGQPEDRDVPLGPSRLAVGAAWLPFLAYAAANVLWVSPTKWLGWIDWFGWFQLLSVMWITLDLVRSPAARRALWGVLVAIAIAAVGLAAYQRFADPSWLMLGRVQVAQYAGRATGPFGIPNSLAALLLLVLPACGALATRRRAGPPARVFFGWTTLVLLFGLGLTISRGAWLGLGAAFVVWPLLRPQRSLRTRLVWSGAAAALVTLAVLGAYLASDKVQARVDALVAEAGERSRPILWRAGWQMVRERPWLGTGAGSYNHAFERHRPEGFLDEPVWAHNDYLNTWSDYGTIGLVLLLGPAAWLLAGSLRKRFGAVGPARRSHRAPQPTPWRTPRSALDDPWVRDGFRIGVLAFALQLLVDFHFKIPALGLAFGVVVALGWGRTASGSDLPANLPAPASSRPLRRSARYAAVAILFLGTGAIATFFGPLYRAEGLRERGREAIDVLVGSAASDPRFARNVATAVRDLEEAHRLMPLHAQAASDLAYAYAQVSLVEPDRTRELGRLAEAAATAAISLSPHVAEFWVRRGVARDMQGEYAAAGDDFTHALALAPRIPLPWYHYAYHLSLRPSGRYLAEAMLGTCLRLDPKNTEALRLRQQLATARASQ